MCKSYGKNILNSEVRILDVCTVDLSDQLRDRQTETGSASQRLAVGRPCLVGPIKAVEYVSHSLLRDCRTCVRNANGPLTNAYGDQPAVMVIFDRVVEEIYE